jgi:predicted phosphohydrolase
MTIWGIADLHLSFARPERRERYAARWLDHANRIEAEWRAAVRPDDLVLIPGDLSMAVKHRDVQPDLSWLDRLPGTKVIAPGNHDRWWNSAQAIRPILRRSILAVEGDAAATHGVIICGARGVPPHQPDSPEAQRRQTRELAILDHALDAARAISGSAPIYVLWHYPPFDQNRVPAPCVARFEAAGVAACVYGHLHSEGDWAGAVQGTVGTVRYHCVAADAVGFRPLRLGSGE